MGFQLCAPSADGFTSAASLSWRAAGFSMGRPFASIPVAQFTGAKGFAEMNFPFSRSIT
jgi:hypothetical protein